MIERFLDFLEKDMAQHPRTSAATFPEALKTRMEVLAKGVTVDLDAPIDGDVAL